MRPEDFDRRTWAALAWARDWAIFRGETKYPEIAAEFNSLYNEQERRDILATVTAMDFANRFMNTMTGQYLQNGAASCDLDGSPEIAPVEDGNKLP